MMQGFIAEEESFNGPPEILGRKRSDVKLVHGNIKTGELSVYNNFDSVASLLREGDMLIFNDSLTIPSSLYGYLKEMHDYCRIHVGQALENGNILVEIRPKELNSKISKGETFVHPESGVQFELERRFSLFPRYFEARTSLQRGDVKAFLLAYGHPIFYEGYTTPYPFHYYKNVFQTEPGSSEYPSASRPFTEEILNNLMKNGVITGTLTLHCNLGSLERDEYEYKNRLLDETYRIPHDLVENVINTKENGGRIIAVGTTVVRALVSSVKNGNMTNLSGQTHIKISGDSDIWPLDGIISGMHDPESSHLELLEAFGGSKLLSPVGLIAHRSHLREHEFGDSMLIL